MATEFLAAFEAIEPLKAAALKAGCPDDGSYLDYAEASDHRIGKAFDNRPEAIGWLKEQIEAGRTTFGCGDLTEVEKIPREKRCRYCICNGERPRTRSVVDDDGESDIEFLDDCAN